MSERQPEHATSKSLLQRARSNDALAWQRLVQLYTPLVYYWCGQWGCRRSDWDDVAQEVFLAVAHSLPTFRHDRPTDTFRGWLRGVTRNTLLMHGRRLSQHPQATGGTDAMLQLNAVPQASAAPQASASADPEAPAEMHVLNQRALEMVKGEFEVKTWQMFWLATVEGRLPVDIAADLGVSAAAVRMAKSRVLRRLKEEFEDLLT